MRQFPNAPRSLVWTRLRTRPRSGENNRRVGGLNCENANNARAPYRSLESEAAITDRTDVRRIDLVGQLGGRAAKTFLLRLRTFPEISSTDLRLSARESGGNSIFGEFIQNFCSICQSIVCTSSLPMTLDFLLTIWPPKLE